MFIRNVDSVVQSLVRNFAEGTEYFKVTEGVACKLSMFILFLLRTGEREKEREAQFYTLIIERPSDQYPPLTPRSTQFRSFQMLVDVFAKEFRADKNAHLKSFHVIVPPLVSPLKIFSVCIIIFNIGSEEMK